MSIAAGTSLGFYEIDRPLSASGMGQVYVAEDTKLHRKVALKVLPPEWAGDPERLKRFQWEAQVLATLNHPNIVTIYSVETHNDLHFFTMELVEGQTLADIIPDGGMDFDPFIALAIPLADALSAAHQRGIIHRDVKPGNVMVRPDGRVKILDFGLAKREPDAPISQEDAVKGHQPHTREGHLMGTIAYMAPEQIFGEPIDHRSDVFSLGIVLFEMATGMRPFEGDSWGRLVSSHMRRKPPSASRYNPSLPPQVERIVQRCLERQPNRRYQTAAELAEELEQLRQETQSGILQSTDTDLLVALTRRPRARALAIAGIALLVIVVLALFWRPWDRAPDSAPGGAEPAATTAAPALQRIVILPLENLGRPEDEYIAAGLTEEITNRLARVSALRVISRTTAEQYDRTGKTVTEIGGDLGVEYLLEGTVRWQPAADGNSRVRVTTQLIRAADDTHVWAESYDQVSDDIFAVQSAIAGEVIRRLDIALQDPEREQLTARPTQDPAAYEAYLRGMKYASRYDPKPENWRLAAGMFQRAVNLDPEFALAWAELSEVHSFTFHLGYDRSEERLLLAREAAERALELDPAQPVGHRALGYYHYWGRGDYARALNAFATAAEKLPNDAQLLAGIAFIRRRQGRFEEATSQLEKAIEIDTRSASFAAELARTHTTLREYQLADYYYDRAIYLAPNQPSHFQFKARNYLLWKGDTIAARRTLERMPRQEETSAVYAWYQLALLEGDYVDALDRLRTTQTELLGLDFALLPRYYLRGYVYYLEDEPSLAALFFDAAQRRLEVRMEGHFDDPRLHSALGLVFAGLGRKEEAIREGELAVRLYGEREDAFILPAFIENLAAIYAMVGEADSALDKIEEVLSSPADLSFPLLRIDPRWRPLHDHPRFRALVGELEPDEGSQ